MNSCRSIELAACTPPLITFIIGTGSVAAPVPPRWRKSETPASAAAAFAAASETARIAFAPRRPLFGVPSRSISRRSSASWSSASIPRTASRISPFAFATAFATPLPPYGSPPSRSSTASCTPVDAPERTATRPTAPESRRTSTSIVGLPRESRIWRAWTSAIRLLKAEDLLGFVEVRVLLLERELAPQLPIPRGELLGLLDAGAEAVAHRAQRQLGVDVQPPRDVHRGEQHVAKLLEHVRVGLDLRLGLAARLCDRLLQLAELVLEVGERALQARVLEADGACAALHLPRVEQRRQARRDVVEHAAAPLLLALDLLPALVLRASAGGIVGSPEDVG